MWMMMMPRDALFEGRNCCDAVQVSFSLFVFVVGCSSWPLYFGGSWVGYFLLFSLSIGPQNKRHRSVEMCHHISFRDAQWTFLFSFSLCSLLFSLFSFRYF